MKTILMRRTGRTGKAVSGAAAIPVGKDTILCATLENADFIIPDGQYELTLTMSPKFGKVLPLLNNVPNRAGIRIHTGTKPEHSTGCILMTPFGKQQITDYINKNNINNEKTFIAIQTTA